MNAFPLWFENVSFAQDPSRFSITGPNIFLPNSPDPPQNGTFNVTSPQFKFSATWDQHNNIVDGDLYYGFELVLPLFAEILGTNGTIVETSCAYPLSGQYDHLPRILFYVLLVMAVLLRRNSWVVGAALGVTMSYSAASAIHFFILLGFHGFKSADIDYFGIFPVLATSVVVLTPIFTWSSTFRSHRAKVVIIYWAILVYVALFLMMFLISEFNKHLRRGYVGSKAVFGPADFLNEIGGFTVCNSTAPACSYDSLYADLTYELFTSCNCIDFCTLLTPPVPLRNGQNMVANVGRNKSNSIIYSEKSGIVNPLFIDITTITQVVLIFALGQGLIALVQGDKTQQQVRDWLYRVLSMKTRNTFNKRESVFLSADQQQTNTYRKGRHWTAKIIAAAYYFLNIVTAVLYLPVFILTVAVGEILVADMPESEHSDAVGAWTPWLSVAIIALGSLILRYHSPLTDAIFDRLKLLCCCCFGRRQRGDEDEKALQEPEDGVRTTAWESMLAFCRHSGYEVKLFFWRIQHRFVEFSQWWANPHHNAANEQSEREHAVVINDEIDRLKAQIKKSVARFHYRHRLALLTITSRRLEDSLIHPPPPPGAPACSCAKCARAQYSEAPSGDTAYHRGYGMNVSKGGRSHMTTVEV
jgi:hypothetical protein